MLVHLLIALFAATAGSRCLTASRRAGLAAWRWMGVACGFWTVTQLLGAYHFWSGETGRPLVWGVALFATAGLLFALLCDWKLITASSGFDLPVEWKVDGFLAGLAAANVVTVFTLTAPARWNLLTTGQSWAVFGLQLVLVGVVALTACGLVWQPTLEGKASFVCLLLAASLQTAAINWSARTIGPQFNGGIRHAAGSLVVYSLIIASCWFGVRARKHRSGIAVAEPRWHSPHSLVAGICVVVQLGVVLRVALEPSARWLPLSLTAASFLLIAYRVSGSASLALRLTERTRERDRMAAMVDMSRAISEAGDPAALLDNLAAASAKAVNGRQARAAILDHHEDRPRWSTIRLAGEPHPSPGYFDALAARIAVENGPFSLARVDPSVPAIVAANWLERGRRSELIAPLKADGAVIGFVELWDADQDWSAAAEDVAVVAAMSQEASLALEHARALAAARRSAEDRALVLRVSQAASSVLGLDTVADQIAISSLGVAGVESCAIELWLPETHEFEVIADRSVDDWPGDVSTGARFAGDSNALYAYAFAHDDPHVVHRGDGLLDDPRLLELMDHWGIGSAVTYPLKADGQLVGLMEIFSREADAFDGAAIRLGEQIAAQAGLAIRHARILAIAKRNAEDRALLLQVSQAATSSSDTAEMLNRIAAITITLPNVESCSVRLWRKELAVVERVAAAAVDGWDILEKFDSRMHTRTLLFAAGADRARAPILIDVSAPDLEPERKARLTNAGVGAMALLPLWIADEYVGDLILASRAAGAFSDDLVRLGEEIAQLTAVAIQRARANDDVRQLADEQAAMLRVSRQVGVSLDTRDVFDEITAAGLSLPGFEAAQLELWHPETRLLEIAGTSFIDEWWPGSPVGTLFSADLWPTTLRVIETLDPLAFDGESTFLTEYEREALFTNDQTGAGLIVPIVSSGVCLGTLTFYSRTVNAFSDRQARLGLSLANQAALAIDRAKVHAALEEQAVTDGLTGLLNHRAVQQRLDFEISRASRENRPVATLMIDVDSFKQINDAFGHVVGDAILREVARTLRRSVRATDHVGRYGGDEFMVILPGADLEEARHAADRIVKGAQSGPVMAGATRLQIQLSVGCAIYPVDGVDPAELIESADRSMYSAKHVHGSAPRAAIGPRSIFAPRILSAPASDAAPQALIRRLPL